MQKFAIENNTIVHNNIKDVGNFSLLKELAINSTLTALVASYLIDNLTSKSINIDEIASDSSGRSVTFVTATTADANLTLEINEERNELSLTTANLESRFATINYTVTNGLVIASGSIIVSIFSIADNLTSIKEENVISTYLEPTVNAGAYTISYNTSRSAFINMTEDTVFTIPIIAPSTNILFTMYLTGDFVPTITCASGEVPNPLGDEYDGTQLYEVEFNSRRGATSVQVDDVTFKLQK